MLINRKYKQGLRKFLWVGSTVLACCNHAMSGSYSKAAIPDSYVLKPFSQEKITVKGVVKNQETGDGIAGVTVSVVGTSLATTTDATGNYQLEGVPSNGQLQFAMVGMQSVTEQVAGRTNIGISLTETNANIDEVVVVGYGTQKRENVTGSVVAVKGTELQKSPALNVSNSIAGRVPGVIATNGSAEPGYDGSTIKIREQIRSAIAVR